MGTFPSMAPAGGGDTHSCAWPGWAAQASCMHGHSWLHSALLCLAGVTVHEPGGQKGGVVLSPGLWN